jgi:nucleoid DNA-binding protein
MSKEWYNLKRYEIYTKQKDITNEVSKRLGIPPSQVEQVVNFCYKEFGNLLEELKHREVYLPSLGSFSAAQRRLEKYLGQLERAHNMVKNRQKETDYDFTGYYQKVDNINRILKEINDIKIEGIKHREIRNEYIANKHKLNDNI